MDQPVGALWFIHGSKHPQHHNDKQSQIMSLVWSAVPMAYNPKHCHIRTHDILLIFVIGQIRDSLNIVFIWTEDRWL